MSFAKDLLLSDVEYCGWANRRLLDACSAFMPEELERDLRTSHTSILATLRHFYDSERVWIDCLQTADGGTWRLPTDPSPQLSLDELRIEWPKLSEAYRQRLKNIPEGNFNYKILLQLPNGAEPRLARWEILRHTLDHSQFHRGQVIGMTRALGRTPPAVNRMDFMLAP